MKRVFKNNVPGSATSGVHLWLLLWKAARAVEADAYRSVRASGWCLSDFGVLEALLHKGPLAVNTLGKKVLLTSGSMTAAVDRLERRGWVERTFDSTDRRARVVRLTASGSKLIRKVYKHHAREMQQVFSSLDLKEREALAGLLRKVGRAAEEQSVRNRSLARREEPRDRRK